jgi:hypothetical protein
MSHYGIITLISFAFALYFELHNFVVTGLLNKHIFCLFVLVCYCLVLQVMLQYFTLLTDTVMYFYQLPIVTEFCLIRVQHLKEKIFSSVILFQLFHVDW